MQNPYYSPSNSQNNPPPPPPHPSSSSHHHHVPYELPPVQSVTSPATLLSAPPSSGLTMAHLLQPVSPQQHNTNHPAQNPPLPPVSSSASSNAPPYPRSYGSSSGSPTEPTTVLPENNTGHAGSISGTSGFSLGQPASQQQPLPASITATSGLQQKRAYRQRRKDPSCDACRERKVKCDASESSSCTECTNRKVRCQFTKETNRRMSSIKQVQDLEKQLVSTKQQLQQLQSGMVRSDNSSMDLDYMEGSTAPGQMLLKLPEIGPRPQRRPKVPVAQDLSAVRTNLRDYSRCIWKVPTLYRQESCHDLLSIDPAPLPPKPLADRLLSQYHACIHSVLPVIHWPSFLADYEQVYRMGTLRGTPREWAAVLFGVLASGSLHTLDPSREQDGREFMRTSCMIIDLFQDDFTVDRARAALLMSIFLYEINSKSASWVWIGSAVRVAQEIGLHLDSGPWPPLESEMRKCVWWGIYAWDRLLALEMGKPVLINDQDCEVDLPCASVDERYISDGCVPDIQRTTPLLATIHVVRSIGQLTRTLRSPTIGPVTIETFERHFDACLATFPASYHPKSNQPLDPRCLAPILYLQNARLILHRHNISPVCPPEARAVGLDYCFSTALDTTHLLSRCLQHPPGGSGEERQAVFASAATTILCMHIWRCVLLLLFRQDYAAALVCVQASAMIGDLRAANVACGRYLAFFLRCLLDRVRRSGPAIDLAYDEELIAYVSGDMQGPGDSSWVWHGSETGAQLEVMSLPSVSPPARPEIAHESIDWEGWEWVQQTVRYLYEQQQQPQQPPLEPQESAKPNESTCLSPNVAPEKSDASRRQSRMTIASII